ncbi:MAG: hypothetical protein R2766_09560 [Saprospiraceae bacterium]
MKKKYTMNKTMTIGIKLPKGLAPYDPEELLKFTHLSLVNYCFE